MTEQTQTVARSLTTTDCPARAVPQRAEPTGTVDPTGVVVTGQPRQFPAWLDRCGPPQLVAEATQRWPWTVWLHTGSADPQPQLAVGDAQFALMLDMAVGHLVEDADDYAGVWARWVLCHRSAGAVYTIAAALVRHARVPGGLIVELDAAAVRTVLAGAHVRPSTLRSQPRRLTADGMLGRLRRANGGDWGSYALTMPLPPLAATPRGDATNGERQS
ncbi:hypothetical protein OHA72_10725 [Dactylosporangium sp. NBC_01737]|uniref:hypothetical protein n=1 Tax=Dactylosporangium sp. NBC_01737 TaxID=2975959 RepID=UPI002E0D27CD|nr:hypothetical protein OHA72_10725 [Dactylosporangium sp. NBC_01737]